MLNPLKMEAGKTGRSDKRTWYGYSGQWHLFKKIYRTLLEIIKSEKCGKKMSYTLMKTVPYFFSHKMEFFPSKTIPKI